MKNIILIGMMGCGKTTTGKLLAQALGWELADTDQMIEDQEGRSIPEIFADPGEGYFRDLEKQMSEALSQRENLIIACGGGLPLRADCIGPLKESGTVFFLNRDPGEIYDTVSMAGRPLGQGGKAAFLDRFALREPVYRTWADCIVDHPISPEIARTVILQMLDLDLKEPKKGA
ncbi:MAG: shikimate kinase [Oscillospiraceae bacterium]|nr:shikimate kinase [Oscillospiraceae bacterium]